MQGFFRLVLKRREVNPVRLIGNQAEQSVVLNNPLSVRNDRKPPILLSCEPMCLWWGVVRDNREHIQPFIVLLRAAGKHVRPGVAQQRCAAEDAVLWSDKLRVRL